jgi:hypothetical protein
MMAAMSQLGETDPASLIAAYFEPGWTDGLTACRRHDD